MATFNDLLRALAAGARAFADVAEAALAAEVPAPVVSVPDPNALLLKRSIALRLAVSTATIDRYVKQGMPWEPFGSSKRFKGDACEAWMKARPVLRAVPTPKGARRLLRKKP